MKGSVLTRDVLSAVRSRHGPVDTLRPDLLPVLPR